MKMEVNIFIIISDNQGTLSTLSTLGTLDTLGTLGTYFYK
jgi:hypothetical protein